MRHAFGEAATFRKLREGGTACGDGIFGSVPLPTDYHPLVDEVVNSDLCSAGVSRR